MGLYDKTIGTLLVGIVFNTFLYGIVTYQFAAYHQTKFHDPPVTRYMVFFLFVLDTFHSVSVVYMAWNYTVTNFNNPAALAVAEWPHTFTPLGNALTAVVTQMYLGARIWRLTSSKFLYGVVVLMAIPSFILGMVCSIEVWRIKILSEFHRVSLIVIVWVSMQVALDMFIATTLVIVFVRSRTGFRKTDTILNRFIRGAIQTGLFATIFCLADLITFLTLPDTNIFTMFAIPTGRIYTNTLLDTLLSRELLVVEPSGAGAVTRTITVDTMCWPPTNTQVISTFQSTDARLETRETARETCDHLSCEDTEGRKCSFQDV